MRLRLFGWAVAHFLKLKTPWQAAILAFFAEGLFVALVVAFNFFNPAGPLAQLSLLFHWFPLTIALLCEPDLDADVDGSPDTEQSIIGMSVFFFVALLQWFIIFFAWIGLLRKTDAG